jgi:hypothetical protein
MALAVLSGLKRNIKIIGSNVAEMVQRPHRLDNTFYLIIPFLMLWSMANALTLNLFFITGTYIFKFRYFFMLKINISNYQKKSLRLLEFFTLDASFSLTPRIIQILYPAVDNVYAYFAHGC